MGKTPEIHLVLTVKIYTYSSLTGGLSQMTVQNNKNCFCVSGSSFPRIRVKYPRKNLLCKISQPNNHLVKKPRLSAFCLPILLLHDLLNLLSYRCLFYNSNPVNSNTLPTLEELLCTVKDFFHCCHFIVNFLTLFSNSQTILRLRWRNWVFLQNLCSLVNISPLKGNHVPLWVHLQVCPTRRSSKMCSGYQSQLTSYSVSMGELTIDLQIQMCSYVSPPAVAKQMWSYQNMQNVLSSWVSLSPRHVIFYAS